MKRIESTQNSLVKQWKKLVATRKERDKSEEFLLEGFHLVEEALKNPDYLISILIRDGVEIPAECSITDVHTIEIDQVVSAEISETEHSQGIFAHCRQPHTDENDFLTWKQILLVDTVQDPGNLGTMIRTADAAGIDAVILGKGSADAYNPKTVRSAQGSHFNIPIIKGDISEWIDRLKKTGIPVIGTGLKNASTHQGNSPLEKFALLMGNEGSGVSPELLEMADHVVKIPMYGKAESLNVAVATGILLYSYVESD